MKYFFNEKIYMIDILILDNIIMHVNILIYNFTHRVKILIFYNNKIYQMKCKKDAKTLFYETFFHNVL